MTCSARSASAASSSRLRRGWPTSGPVVVDLTAVRRPSQASGLARALYSHIGLRTRFPRDVDAALDRGRAALYLNVIFVVARRGATRTADIEGLSRAYMCALELFARLRARDASARVLRISPPRHASPWVLADALGRALDASSLRANAAEPFEIEICAPDHTQSFSAAFARNDDDDDDDDDGGGGGVGDDDDAWARTKNARGWFSRLSIGDWRH